MIHVSTREYRFTHGREPRGRGNWAFYIGTEIFWFNGMYAEAKKAAMARADELGFFSLRVGT